MRSLTAFINRSLASLTRPIKSFILCSIPSLLTRDVLTMSLLYYLVNYLFLDFAFSWQVSTLQHLTNQIVHHAASIGSRFGTFRWQLTDGNDLRSSALDYRQHFLLLPIRNFEFVERGFEISQC